MIVSVVTGSKHCGHHSVTVVTSNVISKKLNGITYYKKSTPGVWIEKGLTLELGVPALVVSSKNIITPFITGRNLILQIYSESASVQKQNFASLSRHTSLLTVLCCESCHRYEAELGIIRDQLSFREYPEWSVPLGWILENSKHPGKSTKKGNRSFNLS